jgi:hypothetical protein
VQGHALRQRDRFVGTEVLAVEMRSELNHWTSRVQQGAARRVTCFLF